MTTPFERECDIQDAASAAAATRAARDYDKLQARHRQRTLAKIVRAMIDNGIAVGEVAAEFEAMFPARGL